MNEQKNNIVIYQTENGETKIDVRLENETIWLSQKAMAELFDVKTPAISKHLKNIFNDGELKEDMVISKMEITTQHGAIKGKTQIKETNLYNLDAIISVGYRVNSTKATKFRIWATQTLKEYLTKGYVINEQKLKAEQEKVKSLQDAISLLSRSLENQVETLKEAKDVARVLSNFAHGLDLLDNFDHKTLDKTGKTKKEVVIISEKEYLEVVNKMKSEFASDVFANPKDNSFSSSVNQIYQTFDGIELYPTLEEKAAMLLYLITKNHSFSDGNKRIAASCFLYFMDRNGMLYKNETPIIDSSTLFALTILIAESDPKEMETIKNVVVSVLNGEKK
jgi:prophage maintenance system killer protein/prophage antirepressor-like protein